MKQSELLVVIASLATLVVVGQSADAQLPGNNYTPNRQPVVSPYINLLRTGSTPAINYYGIVRPEIAFRNNLSQLQGQQQAAATQQQDLAAAMTLPATGHASGFQTQSKYFMNKSGVGAVGAPVAPLPGAAKSPKRGGG